jgi:hypothetical protein
MKEIKNNNVNFWISGNGKDILDWAKISKNQIGGDYNNNLFSQFDNEVDDLVKTWLKDGSFGKIMKSLHVNDSTEILPDNFITFKDSLSKIPDWVNFDLIEQGAKLSQRSGLMGLLILRDFALLGGYIFPGLIKPLIATGALEKGATQRLYNTLGFWIEVSRTTQNAQELRINTALRTRLIHSASRLMIEKKHPDWEFKKYGVPINHADMIATSIAFTLYYLYGLDKMNFKYSKREEEGIFHLWKYVTWLLGVPETIIPSNKKEAINFFYFWTKSQGAPDNDSLKLAESLINEHTRLSLYKIDLINQSMPLIHKSVANYLLDQRILKSLKIPKLKLNYIIPNILRIKNGIPINREKQIFVGNKEQMIVLQDYKNNIGHGDLNKSRN